MRLHDGVLGLMEMLGGVLIRRTIATADVTADEAHAEVDPSGADLQTLFAAFSRRSHFLDLGEVMAFHIFDPR